MIDAASLFRIRGECMYKYYIAMKKIHTYAVLFWPIADATASILARSLPLQIPSSAAHSAQNVFTTTGVVSIGLREEGGKTPTRSSSSSSIIGK